MKGGFFFVRKTDKWLYELFIQFYTRKWVLHTCKGIKWVWKYFFLGWWDWLVDTGVSSFITGFSHRVVWSRWLFFLRLRVDTYHAVFFFAPTLLLLCSGCEIFSPIVRFLLLNKRGEFYMELFLELANNLLPVGTNYFRIPFPPGECIVE